MQISGMGNKTYLYINGLAVNEELELSENMILLPAKSPSSWEKIFGLINNDIDFGIAVIFLSNISSQLRIISTDPQNLAISAWNSLWDLVLLSAIFNCQAECNLQCTQPIECINEKSILEVTNYHMRGLVNEPYTINQDNVIWLKEYYKNAQSLLNKNNSFSTAVHSLSSYRWHPLPRIQIAVLWAGIESLFGVDSELSFRLSIYIAKFLEEEDSVAQSVFNEVKGLYKSRSSAVHGSNIKGNQNQIVEQSAILLKKLIIKCIITNRMPDIDNLLF